jgi:hypothetical protein
MQWFKWIYDSKIRLFSFFWLLLFVLYLPTWRAGFVSDFTGWLYDIRYSSFADHINRSHFQVKSLYQFTQLVTWFLYQIFGTNHFLWHCMHISLHALNVRLLFTIITALFTNKQNIDNRPAIFAAMLFFCISPTLSEVVVWEASFHYLLGFLMFLSILRLVQLYHQSPSNKRLWTIAALYFLSTFSIELFYITPFCVAALLIFYNNQSPLGGIKWPQKLALIVAPQLLLLFFHFVLVKINFGFWLPHISTGAITDIPHNVLLSKPLKHLFHLLFFGRFYSQDFRDKVYIFCELYPVIIAFYGLILAALPYYCLRSQKMQTIKWPFLLILFWTISCVALITPLWFPTSFWVEYDRYNYFYMGLCFVLLCILANHLLPKFLSVLLFVGFVAANFFASYKVNQKWNATSNLTHQLMLNLPKKSTKKVLILNMPNVMNGICMITTCPQNEVKLMHNLLYDPPIKTEMIDVCGSNILSVTDGVHVRVLNDSTIFVMQNQNGTWFWYNYLGASDREHPYFSVKMVEYGYNLILKGKPEDFLLLFQTGNQWKEVDVNKRDIDQF